MHELPPEVGDIELRRVAQWAGFEPDAMAIAARGAARLGPTRWRATFAREPEVWMQALGGGALMQRWRRRLGRMAPRSQRVLHRLALSPVGLEPGAMLACASRPSRALDDLAAALDSGWAAWRDETRVEVPAMRLALLGRWTASEPGAERWFTRYTARTLHGDGAWSEDDRECLASALRVPRVARGLTVEEVRRGFEILRRTRHAEVANDALRARAASDVDALPTLQPTLGAACLDLGRYREGLSRLKDRSRASRIMRAHAFLRMGELARGKRLLRGLRPRAGDPNWELQCTLAAISEGDTNPPKQLRVQLGAARSPRVRALGWLMYAEWADRHEPRDAWRWYRRALHEVDVLEDVLTVAYASAGLARALARSGRRDEARRQAADAWDTACATPSAALRGLGALACVESGVARGDAVRRALRGAATSDLPSLADDARRALGADPGARVLCLGPGTAQLDGVRMPLASEGPPWRVLVHLCALPAGSIVSLEELFEAGWPGERVRPESRRKRVHTAVWTLRRAGLRDVLQTVGRNRYRLRARVVSDDSV